MYNVRLEVDLAKICKKFPLKDKEAIFEAIKSLEINPRPNGVIKLAGRDGYRMRVGDYRIIYHIKDRELLVLVVDIDGRADIYKKR
ncbi:MAG: type II toxin-antitoxin system RelE/ParE family toxin [Parachlamydia sp.]|nr:type II toxin-antitoxin system RelE/ParE family toxin [Parachlamydia sp.]